MGVSGQSYKHRRPLERTLAAPRRLQGSGRRSLSLIAQTALDARSAKLPTARRGFGCPVLHPPRVAIPRPKFTVFLMGAETETMGVDRFHQGVHLVYVRASADVSDQFSPRKNVRVRGVCATPLSLPGDEPARGSRPHATCPVPPSHAAYREQRLAPVPGEGVSVSEGRSRTMNDASERRIGVPNRVDETIGL